MSRVRTEVRSVKVETNRCGRCRHDNFKYSVRCESCGLHLKVKDTEEVLEEVPEKAYKTHNKFRFYCRNCGATGQIWLRKGRKPRSECPSCAGPRYRILFQRVPEHGTCNGALLWNEPEDKGKTRAVNVYKKQNCNHCGYRMNFLIRPPEECPRCKNDPLSDAGYEAEVAEPTEFKNKIWITEQAEPIEVPDPEEDGIEQVDPGNDLIFS